MAGISIVSVGANESVVEVAATPVNPGGSETIDSKKLMHFFTLSGRLRRPICLITNCRTTFSSSLPHCRVKF